MDHLKTYRYGLEIRQFSDDGSPSGSAWIIDLMNGGECIGEAIGVAPVLAAALAEAARSLTGEIASDYLAERLGQPLT